MLKLLKGDGLSFPVLTAVNHGCYVAGSPGYSVNDTTKYCFELSQDADGAHQMIVDTDSSYFAYMPEEYASRLVDYVPPAETEQI
jgi:hypothetical protein